MDIFEGQLYKSLDDGVKNISLEDLKERYFKPLSFVSSFFKVEGFGSPIFYGFLTMLFVTKNGVFLETLVKEIFKKIDEEYVNLYRFKREEGVEHILYRFWALKKDIIDICYKHHDYILNGTNLSLLDKEKDYVFKEGGWKLVFDYILKERGWWESYFKNAGMILIQEFIEHTHQKFNDD